MQTIFTNIKCREMILSNANENWYIILYDLFSRLWYIATCGPFCKDATHIAYRKTHSTYKASQAFDMLMEEIEIRSGSDGNNLSETE